MHKNLVRDSFQPRGKRKPTLAFWKSLFARNPRCSINSGRQSRQGARRAQLMVARTRIAKWNEVEEEVDATRAKKSTAPTCRTRSCRYFERRLGIINRDRRAEIPASKREKGEYRARNYTADLSERTGFVIF